MLCCCVLLLVSITGGWALAASVDSYNVVWDSPSDDHHGSMPLGNGDIGLNAWFERTGDLAFYISKTDAWGDNGRLLKVGKIRVTFDPPIVTERRKFLQTLRLQDATMEVQVGANGEAVTVELWVDANRSMIHVAVNSARPRTAIAHIELWRNERTELPSIEVSDVMLDRSLPNSQHGPTIVEPDTILTDQHDRIGWYHHNVKSVGPELTARMQGLTGFQRPDPLLHRTFGAVVTAEGGKRIDDLHLQSPSAKRHRFSIYVETAHPATPAQWLKHIDDTIRLTEAKSFDARRAEHAAWWSAFWNRSWIHVSQSKTSTPPAVIPINKHPLRVGVDQSDRSRFRGTIRRVSLFDRALDAKEIEALAANQESRLASTEQGLIGSWSEFTDPNVDIGNGDVTRSLTIEAWIQPAEREGTNGRIVDKITPGGSDGFLLDAWPGNSLRFIVGGETLTADKCLKPGQWHHTAAVVDTKQEGTSLQLWLDGRPVAERTIVGGDDATVVSRGYILQRFINACAGRGHYPIKFNGSIFTVPYAGKPGDADYRRWGPGYWWQNTRLPYIGMCTSGDFDMMQPLFHMYVDQLLPLCRYRTRHYLGHGGAYYPECIYFWGDVFSDTYGWTPFEERTDKLQKGGWHKWEWVGGQELVWMMFDYYDHTQDAAFLHEKLLPAAHEILTFFDEHYATDDRGKLVMHPSQALETWWDCTNPMPELAGLHALTRRLLRLPQEHTTAEQRAFWNRLLAKLPDLPTREVDGVLMLAPAERFAMKHNIENPELYAVFPFRLVSFEQSNAELGIEALRHRWDRGNSGWRQDDIFMAYLGLADEARDNLVGRARKKHSGSRFPAFWGPNYDWVPDQDHGGVLMKALQAMLIQVDPYSEKIYLFPAWPADWDADFKVHAPGRTTLEGELKNGQLQNLSVTPESRQEDVVICLKGYRQAAQ